MRNIYRNKPANWVICIILTIAIILTPMAPLAALPMDEWENIKAESYADTENSINNPETDLSASSNNILEATVARDEVYNPPPSVKLYNEEIEQAIELLKATDYYSSLSDENAEILCAGLNVNSDALWELEANGYSLSDSILYAQLEYQFTFPIRDILAVLPSLEDCMQLNIEMDKYAVALGQYIYGSDLDKELRHYMLMGFTCGQVNSAYSISSALDIDIENLLLEKPQIAAPLQQADSNKGLSLAEQKKYDEFSEELNINKQPLIDYAGANGFTFDELIEIIEDRKHNEIVQSAIAQTAATASISTPNTNEVVPVNQVNAPFSYAYEENEAINLNTGALTYQVVDATIPGRNGLDLVIARRYDSSDANLFNPKTAPNFSIGYTNPNPPYIVKWGYKAYLYTYYNDREMIYSSEDQGPYYEIFSTYSQANSYAISKLNSGEKRYSYPNSANSDTLILRPYTDISAPTESIFHYIYISHTENNNYLNNKYGLGQGWSFAFSSIQTINDTKYLHLDDGRRFEINKTFVYGNSNLKDYSLTDLRIMQESNGYEGAAYTLYHKDGRREHFNSNGQLIAIRDRYNNTISFAYSTQNGLPMITISDTLNRKTTISATSVNSNGHVMTAVLPDGNTLKYTVDKVSDYYGIALNGYALAKFENQLNYPTYYQYDLKQARFNLYDKGVLSNIELADSIRSVDKYDLYNPTYRLYEYYYLLADLTNFYLNLSAVIYPTNNNVEDRHSSNYYYNKATLNLGSGGRQESFYIRSRSDMINGSQHNRKAYSFNYRYGVDGNSCGYSGYPFNDPNNLPDNYTYHCNVEYNDIVTYITFNNKHLPIGYTEHNGDLYCFSHKKVEYNPDKLPTKITTKKYNMFSMLEYDPYTGIGQEPPCLTSIEAYEYDNKGNITASWSPLANGNTANTEHKTTYTYDPNYSLPLTKTYKQDINTTITERNTVSGPNIIRQEILLNNVVKSKTEYVYGNQNYPGNLTATKWYRDDLSTFIETSYGYKDNVYISEIKNTGIRNSDGSLATRTPGQLTDGIIVSAFDYDNMGRLTKVIDANNQPTIYAYNALGDITTQINPDNTTIIYDRDYLLNRLTVTDENGARIRYDYTPSGLEYEVSDIQPNGAATPLSRKTYDNLSRLKTETDLLNGATTTYDYDHYSRLTSKVTKNSANTTLAQETYVYNEAYNSGANGILQRIQKTVLGETNAPNIVTTQYINNIGQIAQEGKVLNGTEHLDYYTYDYVGNKTQENLAYAVAKNLSYSAKWEYDYAGRVTRAYNADGGYTTNTYNALGQLTTATDYAGTATTYSYDDLDRLLEEKGIIDQSGSTVYNSFRRYDYDPAGNITKTRASNNQVGLTTAWAITEYAYNNRNRLEYVTLYDGANIDNVTKYTYDGVGNTKTMRAGMSSKTDAGGQQTSYDYDRLGRIQFITDALGQQEVYVYKNNGLGLLDTKTDRNGNVSAYNYDALGRVLSEQVKTPENITETNSYSYYLTGAKKTESNPTVVTTYIYDTLGRLTQESESGGAGAVKVYGYDIANNRTNFNATRSGTTIHNTTYTYDNQNRLKTVSDNGSLKATYNYNANGARESLIYTNGTREDYYYNKANWLTSLVNKSSNTTVSSYDYTYYADGNQRTKTDYNGRVTTYAYDGAGRLKSESENTGFSATYQYDRYGNRKKMTVTGADAYTVDYNYDNNNRLTQDIKTAGNIIITGTYHYDPNGNQLAKVSETLTPTTGSGAQVGFDPANVELYEYDGFNRLVRSSVNGEETIYTYRADGLRSSKTSATGTITHVWDGANIVADLNSGTIVARYVRGVNLLFSDSNAGQKFYLFDGHGDVVQLASSSGAILWRYDYDAFGNEREIAGKDPSLDANPFRYCGEYFDKETGSIYLRARYYSPVMGRFRTEDAVRSVNSKMPNEQELPDPLSLNLYTYCYNSPIKNTDPTGHIILVDDAIILVYATGVAVTVSYAWLISPAGQKAIEEGAIAIQNGVVIAGKAITSAAKVAADAVVSGAKWIGEKASDAWTSITAAKPINLPSWKKVTVDKQHIMNNHFFGGSGGPNKSKFPPGTTEATMLKIAEQAYKNAEKIGELQHSWYNGVEMVKQQFQALVNGVRYEFWFNYTTKTMETLYPKF